VVLLESVGEHFAIKFPGSQCQARLGKEFSKDCCGLPEEKVDGSDQARILMAVTEKSCTSNWHFKLRSSKSTLNFRIHSILGGE
jgi:hypothetical protein